MNSYSKEKEMGRHAPARSEEPTMAGDWEVLTASPLLLLLPEA